MIAIVSEVFGSYDEEIDVSVELKNVGGWLRYGWIYLGFIWRGKWLKIGGIGGDGARYWRRF